MGVPVHLRREGHPSEPSASFLGKRKAECGHHFYPFSLKPTIRMVFCGRSDHHWGGLSALENALQPVLNHGRSLGFPSLQYRSRAALTQKPQCYGRVCTTVCEAGGNFTCRFKSIIMTQNLKIWNCQKCLVSSLRLRHAEPDMK